METVEGAEGAHVGAGARCVTGADRRRRHFLSRAMDTAATPSCRARESATNPSGPTACKPAVPFSRRPGENDSALRAQRLQVHIEPVARRLVYGPRGAKDSNAMVEPCTREGGIPV